MITRQMIASQIVALRRELHEVDELLASAQPGSAERRLRASREYLQNYLEWMLEELDASTEDVTT